jgi:hypothetical protein
MHEENSFARTYIALATKMFGVSPEYLKISSAYIYVPKLGLELPYTAFCASIANYGRFTGHRESFVSYAGLKIWLEEHDLVED